MKYMAVILIFSYSCTFRFYPTRIFPVDMDKAIGWDGKIKISTFSNEKFVFDSITKDDQGKYFGNNKFKRKNMILNLEDIKEIKLEDRKKTFVRSIFIDIVFSGITFISVVLYSLRDCC